MKLDILNLQRRVPIRAARLRRLASRTLRLAGRAKRDVHLTVVDDREIRRLNARYLGERRPTDVLAFNLESPGPSSLLGEVIISAETAARQAAALRIPVVVEIDLLLVHGLLHLLGYDDKANAAARRMHGREREILSQGRRRPLPARLWTDLLPGDE